MGIWVVFMSLALVNSAAIQEFSSFPDTSLGVGLLDHMVTLFLLSKPSHCVTWLPSWLRKNPPANAGDVLQSLDGEDSWRRK